MQYQALVLKRFLDVDQLGRVAVSLLLTTPAPGFVSYFVTVKVRRRQSFHRIDTTRVEHRNLRSQRGD